MRCVSSSVMRKLAIELLVSVAAVSAYADRPAFERYQSIVDRQMFGQPPPGFDPTKMPSEVAKSKGDAELTKEQEQVKKAIRFSVINVTSSGETVVGFSDNGDPKNPLHYYLKVGESQNGWTVKAADPDEATMTIEKGEIEVTLKLGGDSATEAGAVVNRAAENNSNGTSLRARRRQEDLQRKEREDRRDQMQNELLSEMQRMREEREAERAAKAAAELAAAQKEAEAPPPQPSEPPSEQSE